MKKLNLIFLYLLFAIASFSYTSTAFSGSTTLSWQAPTINSDGTPIIDLAGFKVYYGTSSNSYSQNIDIGNLTTYKVDNLTGGLTYYFAVTAYDTSGNESEYSDEVIITIPLKPTLTDLPKTGQVVGYQNGDDGYIQAGIESPNQRFTDNDDGTVTDNLTGLMWLKDGDCIKKKRWEDSLYTIKDFNTNPGNYNCIEYIANYSDWRLPNIKELESLVHYGSSDLAAWLNNKGFVNVQSFYYWSSTTYLKPSSAMLVKMSDGSKKSNSKRYKASLLIVRTAASGNPYNLPKTGQTASYATGDDGYIQAGIEWPSQRFIDNGDGTITDALTGLIWLKDGGCIKKNRWGNSLTIIEDFNTNPGNYNCLEYISNYSDWRLPNIKELESLVHHGTSDSAAWLNNKGFVNVQSFYYWSSTTYQRRTKNAWMVNMRNSMMFPTTKNKSSYVWPVRAGY